MGERRETYASNPGEIKLDILRFTILRRGWPIALLLMFLGVSYLAFVVGPLWWGIAYLFIIGLTWLYYAGAKRQFEGGDVNISKVISLNPPRFATSTNMRNSFGPKNYPVIKIVADKIPNTKGKKYAVGDYFPAACLYSGSFEKEHWDDFDPDPLSVGTGDDQTIKTHMDNLADLIEDFEKRLSLVKDLKTEGIHFLDEAKLYPESRTPPEGPTTLDW